MIICPHCKHVLLSPDVNHKVMCGVCQAVLTIEVKQLEPPKVTELELIEIMNVNPDYKKELKDQYEREHPKSSPQ
jgi:uncharacterized Zn finger protein (UPF0148 family)